MRRFFLDQENITGDLVEIRGDNFNHIAHSLRLQPGERIIISDGQHNVYRVQLDEFYSDRVQGHIIDEIIDNTEPVLQVTLAQAIPKNKNMELVVEKTTELGVRKIIPLNTERTVVHLTGKKARKRVERWQRIAEAAAGQSGRSVIPRVTDIYSLQKLCDIKDGFDLIITLRVGENDTNFKKLFSRITLTDKRNVLVIVGPEGGLTAEEVNTINGTNIGLGPRVLRTETAGLVALSILLHETGEMGG